MTKPIKPSSSSASTGEGKSFLERMQRGMANDPTANPEKAKLFADTLERMVKEGKAITEARNEYKKVPGLSRAGGGGGGGGIPKVGPKKPLEMKAGGKVSSASKRADGCAIKGKTKGKMV